MKSDNVDRDILEEMKRYGELLEERGLNMTSKSGNLSVRRGDIIYITGRGTSLWSIDEGGIVEMGLQGEEDRRDASMEAGVHLAVYMETDALSVIHAHTPFAVALSLARDEIIPLDAEGRYHYDEVPVVDVENPIGSKDLEDALPEVLKDHGGAIVKGHGTFTSGETLKEAYYRVTVIESICQIVYMVGNLEGGNS